jgi:hypothetical protein
MIDLVKTVVYILGSVAILYAFACVLDKYLPVIHQRFGGGKWW